MSRSRKKTAVYSVCCYGRHAQKKWKTQSNRRMRRISPETEISNGANYKRFSGDLWNSPCDGRFRSDNEKDYRK